MAGLSFKRKIGQSTLEYAIVIAVIVAALVVMETYIKRGVQGRLRQASDDIGEQFTPNVSYNWATTYDSQVAENIDTGGKIKTTYTRDKQDRTGSETVNLGADYWPAP